MSFLKVLKKLQEDSLSIGILAIKPSKTAIDIANKISKQLKDDVDVDVDKVIFEYLKSQGRTKTSRLGQEIRNHLYSLGLITKQQALGSIEESFGKIGFALKRPNGNFVISSRGTPLWFSTEDDAEKANKSSHGGECKIVRVSLKKDKYSYNGYTIDNVLKESIKANKKTFTPEEAKKEVEFLRKAIKETTSKAMKSEYTNKLNNLLNSMEDNNISEGWKKISDVDPKDATSKVKEFYPDAKVRRGTDDENEYIIGTKIVASYNTSDYTLLIKEGLTPEQQKKEDLKKKILDTARLKNPKFKDLSDDELDYDEKTNTVTQKKLSPVEKAKLKTLKVK